MRFFREHSRLISRLFINQIGMTIFGAVLTMAVMRATDSNPTLTMLVSLFSILFYLCLIYNVMWEEGARNIVRIEAGRMEKIRGFSFKAALLASVPNLVLGGLLLVFYLFGYYPFGLELAKSFYGILHILLGLFEAMYVGLFSAVLGLFGDLTIRYFVAALLYLFSSLPMILVSMLAYRLGSRNIYLFGKRTPKKGSAD